MFFDFLENRYSTIVIFFSDSRVFFLRVFFASKVNISNRKMDRVAFRLQRIRRVYALRKAAKLLWWRKYAAITIQRFIRG